MSGFWSILDTMLNIGPSFEERMTPGMRRNARVALISVLITTGVALLGNIFQVSNEQFFNELIKAFGALGLPGAPVSLTAERNLELRLFFSLLFLISYGSVWAGTKLSQVGKIVAAVLLTALGFVCQWLIWKFAGASGHPLSQLLACAAGIAAGIILKADDDRKMIMDSQYDELKLRNKELQESRLALVKSDETERRLLAADLHDQVLNDMKQIAQKFEHFVEANDADSSRFIKLQLAQVMTEIGEIMDNLRPDVLEHFGLAKAVEECLKKGATRSGFEIRLVQTPQAQAALGQLGQVEQLLIYRLVQESVTNICKHADARMVEASIDFAGDELVFRVNDDGKGLPDAAVSKSSRGLVYMRLRASLIGGRISWMVGKNEKGTCVEITVPVPSAVQTVEKSA